MAFSIAIAAGVATKDMRTVTVSYDGKLYEVTTRADNVAGALKDAGIVLATEDKVNYDLTCSIDGISGIIEVEKPITLTVNMAGQEKVITTYTKDVDKVLEENDIDLSVDGADEVDGDFNLIKGGGAAHTKEKIVDYAAKEFIVIVDESKVVGELGTFPVPVEVIPDASRVVIQALEDMGAECEIRMAQRKDGPVITDNGNFVIDAKFDKIESPAHLEIDLNSIPGVVENGIFSQMVDKVIIGTDDGTKEL